MIVEAEALEEQVEAAQAAGRVAIDTEMVWERTFYPDLGVVQIGLDRERCFLVDTVALEGDMASLGQLIQDEKTQKKWESSRSQFSNGKWYTPTQVNTLYKLENNIFDMMDIVMAQTDNPKMAEFMKASNANAKPFHQWSQEKMMGSGGVSPITDRKSVV